MSELEVIPPAVLPELITAPNVDDAVALQRAYFDLCARLLDDTDIQEYRGKELLTRSGYQKLAAAFNVSTEVVLDEETYGDDGRIVRAKYRVRATAPNGRHATGTGLASVYDYEGVKPEHDIPATAETRATNRACSNLFGLGAVSAEEVSGGRERDSTPSRRGSPGSTRALRGASRGSGTAAAPNPNPPSMPELLARIDALEPAAQSVFTTWRTKAGIPWPRGARPVQRAAAAAELERITAAALGLGTPPSPSVTGAAATDTGDAGRITSSADPGTGAGVPAAGAGGGISGVPHGTCPPAAGSDSGDELPPCDSDTGEITEP